MYEELMAKVVDEENAAEALETVIRNGGAPGIDGMTTGQLREHGRAVNKGHIFEYDI